MTDAVVSAKIALEQSR